MGTNALLIMFFLAAFAPFHWALLHDIHDVIDFSNLDLRNYQFFRNLASQDPRRAGQTNLILEHFQKKKAIIDYVENLFFGNSPFAQESEIPFDPHYGRAWRPTYVRKFGWRGERLIEALGHGYSVGELRSFGAIPREYGTRNYPD